MSNSEKEAQLLQWFESHSLDRHAEKLMDVNGEVGLSAVEDLLVLSDEDVHRIGEDMHMNMIERRRFAKAVQSLRSPYVQTQIFGAPLADPVPGDDDNVVWSMSPAELDAAIAREAGTVDQFEVVGDNVVIRKAPRIEAASVSMLRKGRLLHAHKERVLGADGRVWAELTALELRRSSDATAQVTRGFVLIQDANALQLRKLGKSDEHPALGQQEVDPANTRKLLEAMATFDELPDHAELFEVMKSAVVQKAPSQTSARVGTLQQGKLVHVKKANRVYGVDDLVWVELTNLELWRSCDVIDANDRGYVLVDGNLEGPRTRAWAQQRWGRGLSEAQFLALTQPKSRPFEGVAAYAELYEVVKNLVYVNQTPDKDGKTLGVLKRGQIIQVFRGAVQDKGGHDWVELTNYELWHSCQPKNPEEQFRGFALVQGNHLNLGELLRGPFSKGEFTRWQEQALREEISTQSEKEAERAQRMQEAEQVRSRRIEADDDTRIYEYKALRDKVFLKWSDDPRYEWVTESSVEPGTSFFSNGMEWFGKNGERWISGCVADIRPRWVLAEDPFVVGGPYLVEKSFAEDNVRVCVHYATVKGAKSFETFMDKHIAVKVLKDRVCKELKVMPDFVILKAKRSKTQVQTLDNTSSLVEQNITSSTHVFIQYDHDLYSQMMVGRGLGWL